MVRIANRTQTVPKENPASFCSEKSVARRHPAPRFGAILVAAVLSLQLVSPVFAGDQYAMAVKLFELKDYHSAATRFEKITQEQPKNEKAHYYLGLAYKAQGQLAAAEREFLWVSENGFDKTCVDYSRQQIMAMRKPTSSVRQKPKAIQVAQFGGSQSSSYQSPSSGSQTAGAQAPAKKNLGRCKVIFFETSWCHYCHEFAPQFDEAKRKYQNKMDFQQLDAEGDGAGLAEKYGIHSYPRLVYLDGSGKLLYNEGRGQFQERINELTAP